MSYPTYSLFPSTSEFTITREQFNAFHNIDRMLFSRLVMVIGQDRTESMQIMAMWLWLERYKHGRNLVWKILTFPDRIINILAQETVLCLITIMGDDSFPVNNTNDTPLLQGVLGVPINSFYFYENRIQMLLGHDKIMKEVCLRAFSDIVLQPAEPVLPNVQPRGRNVYDAASRVDEIGEMLRDLGFVDDQETEVEGIDKRTLFLTFSKGYATSEFEVGEFFTRRYGNIIEEIQMQEVLPEEQVLYAKLIVHSIGAVDQVLGGQQKAKFTINGKHVWARKFVKKPYQV